MVDFTDLLRAAIGDVKLSEGTFLGQKVFASPLTPAVMQKLARKHPNFMQSPTTEGMVDLLIDTMRNADEAKALTLEHKALMMRMPLSTITDVFGQLFGQQMVVEDEEAQDVRKGKSEATS